MIMWCLDSVKSVSHIQLKHTKVELTSHSQFLFIWINFSHFCQLECPQRAKSESQERNLWLEMAHKLLDRQKRKSARNEEGDWE